MQRGSNVFFCVVWLCRCLVVPLSGEGCSFVDNCPVYLSPLSMLACLFVHAAVETVCL